MSAAEIRVDVVILSLTAADDAPCCLQALVVTGPAGQRTDPGDGERADGGPGIRLPGGELLGEEDLEGAAARIMAGVGLTAPRHVEQLASFGRPDRMPDVRTVSVSYLALVPEAYQAPEGCRWVDATAPGAALAWDHEEILTAAVQRIRSKLSYSNIAYGLLPDEFTMSELQEVYEAVLGTTLDKRNFRRKVQALPLLVETGRQRRGQHRPAALFRFASTDLVLLDDVIASASAS